MGKRDGERNRQSQLKGDRLQAARGKGGKEISRSVAEKRRLICGRKSSENCDGGGIGIAKGISSGTSDTQNVKGSSGG